MWRSERSRTVVLGAAFAAFVDGRIGFLDMAEIVERVMDQMVDFGPVASMDAVFAADAESRRRAAQVIEQTVAAA